MTPERYETGATTHAVNELILFTDNTPKCVAKRDELFKRILDNKWEPLPIHFIPLLEVAQAQYYWEIKDSDKAPFTTAEEREYCALYVTDFYIWKKENELIIKL